MTGDHGPGHGKPPPGCVDTDEQHEWMLRVCKINTRDPRHFAGPSQNPAHGAAAAPAAGKGKPDAASHKANLTGLVKQIAPATADDPARRADLLKLATSAQAALNDGDLDAAAVSIEALRQALEPAADRASAQSHADQKAVPEHPAAAASGGAPDAPAGEAKAGVPHGEAASGRTAAVKPEKMFDGAAQANPFDAPEAQVEIGKLALPTIRQLAVAQAQNAFNDFRIAADKVRADRKAKAEEAEKHRELMFTIVITIALMPAGPLIEAAANGVINDRLRQQILEKIVSAAPALQQKFGASGAAVANTAFDTVASDAVAKLAAKFNPASAKKALDSGVDKLKDKAVKFAASSDEEKCVNSFLDALVKSAADAMHNLTDVIGTAHDYSGALAYYNMFHIPLLASYEAAIGDQVEHMLRQIKEPLAHNGEPQTIAADDFGRSTTAADEIVKVDLKGRKLLAHAVRMESAPSTKPTYTFKAWITPDMQAAAVKLIKEEIHFEQFQDSAHVPQPGCEPGERVVLVTVAGQDRMMLIDIEDEGIFWREYGVRIFKQWAETDEDTRVFRTRGASQIGGIDAIDVKTVKKVPHGS